MKYLTFALTKGRLANKTLERCWRNLELPVKR